MERRALSGSISKSYGAHGLTLGRWVAGLGSFRFFAGWLRGVVSRHWVGSLAVNPAYVPILGYATWRLRTFVASWRALVGGLAVNPACVSILGYVAW